MKHLDEYGLEQVMKRMKSYIDSQVSTVITFDNITAAYGDSLIKREGNIIKLSTDNGKNYRKELDISELGNIVFFHVFEDDTILLAGNKKVGYSSDWTTLNISTVYDINGVMNPSLSSSAFSTVKHTNEVQLVNGVEMKAWGNYGSPDEANVWYTVDGGKTVKSAFKFGESIPSNRTEPIVCGHIHNVDFNPADNTFWVQTGDEPRDIRSHWLKGVYDIVSDTWTWEVIGTGDHYKTSNMIFYNDYIYYAWDVPFGGVARVPYVSAHDPSAHELVFATPNDCIGIIMGPRGDMLALITLYGGVKRATTIYYSENLVDFHEIRGVVPADLDYDDTIYYSTWPPNNDGKILSGIVNLDKTYLVQWDRTPSIWLDEVVRRAGFPDAFKP